jgi:AcrR family transcriptional regulator
MEACFQVKAVNLSNQQTLPQTVRSKRRRKSRDVLKNAILSAAAAAMTGSNRGDLTLVQIAKTLGISPSTIYEHFANKNALINAVWTRLSAANNGVGTTNQLPEVGRPSSSHKFFASGQLEMLQLSQKSPTIWMRFAKLRAHIGVQMIDSQIASVFALLQMLDGPSRIGEERIRSDW